LRTTARPRDDGFSVRDLGDFGQNSQSFPSPTSLTSSRQVEKIVNDPASQPLASGIVQQIVQ
jgi:hypothetical protein